MFSEMRRKNQALRPAECEEILSICTHGVLALDGDDGYPYALPISYVYADGHIYFHCAVEGHKLRAIRRNDRASFCVVSQDDIVPERFTTHYRSVIAFGRMRELEGSEKRAAIERIARRYSPNESDESITAEIDGSFARVCLLELAVEHMTGKESRELMEMRKKSAN